MCKTLHTAPDYQCVYMHHIRNEACVCCANHVFPFPISLHPTSLPICLSLSFLLSFFCTSSPFPSLSAPSLSASRWCTSFPLHHSGSLSVTGAPETQLLSAPPPLMAMSACTPCWEEKGVGPISQLNNG